MCAGRTFPNLAIAYVFPQTLLNSADKVCCPNLAFCCARLDDTTGSREGRRRPCLCCAFFVSEAYAMMTQEREWGEEDDPGEFGPA